MQNKKENQPIPINKGTNFLVSIYYQDNHSYQGSIQWLDTGKKVNFRSERELLNLIHEAASLTNNSEQDYRTWQEDNESNVG